ncbi:MAG: TetR family transcriptional regulator, partial [Alphaproteobacteria bacterium]
MVRLDVKEMRRRQLTQATITVIARRGFARTTLADVAKEARVSYGVVSFYFGSKEELLLATLRCL